MYLVGVFLAQKAIKIRKLTVSNYYLCLVNTCPRIFVLFKLPTDSRDLNYAQGYGYDKMSETQLSDLQCIYC